MTVRFSIHVTPRTKKTHSRIVSMGKPCYVCKRKPIQRIIPSEGFEEFERDCLMEAVRIRPRIEDGLAAKGYPPLPLAGPVSVCALFYREADRGDATGYMQAMADVLQTEAWSCTECKKRVPITAECPCGAPWSKRKQTRKGMGIIGDDSQIHDWDGTRLLKDASRPRIELTITTVEPPLLAGATA